MRDVVRVLGVYHSAEALGAAIEQLRAAGYEGIDSFTPYHLPGDPDIASAESSRLPALVAGAGALGALLTYAVQYWTNVISYPLNAGGRPLHAFPAFAVSAVVIGLLCAGVAAFAGMLWRLRLPRWHHPLFEHDGFDAVSRDRFWVAVEPGERAGVEQLEAVLRSTGARAVHLS